MKMRYVLFIAVVCALVATAVLAPTAAAKKDPFIGKWQSTDVDGSTQFLNVGGGPGNTYHVRYFDQGASLCGLDPITHAILYAGTAKTVLEANGNVLSGELPVFCLESPPVFLGKFPIYLVYDPVADTMIDPSIPDVVWQR